MSAQSATVQFSPAQLFQQFFQGQVFEWRYCKSDSASGLFDISGITDSLKESATSPIIESAECTSDESTEDVEFTKQESILAIKVLKNRKLAIDAAKKAFGIELNLEVHSSSDTLANDIQYITHALRNVDVEDIMFTKPAQDELDFFYAFSENRVMKLQSSFPRLQDDEVIVSFYKKGQLLYMNNIALNNLAKDLENYL